MAETPPCLVGNWVWSHDEEGGAVAVYRPEGYPLPPARGRDRLEFRPGGAVTQTGPGASDALAASEGNWSAEGDAPSVDLPVGPGAAELAGWTVEACSADVLKLRRRAP